MRISPAKHRLSLACITLFALGSIACGDDTKDEAGDADGTGTAETGGETADGPETGESGMEGDGDGDGEAGDGDGDEGDGDGDPEGGDGDGDEGDGDGDQEAGDGDGDPNSPCLDYENQDDCEGDAACQSVMGQALSENGPDAPCLEPAEFLGCIEMAVCDDALTWFCVGGNAKPVLVNNGCGPDGAEMCEPPVQDPPQCP
jgi:hypothetical protein